MKEFRNLFVLVSRQWFKCLGVVQSACISGWIMS